MNKIAQRRHGTHPETPRLIRILIVDDIEKELVSIAENVRRLAAILHPNLDIEIELSQNAHWVASIISGAKRGPSWDLVLSDVFMPEPKRLGYSPENCIVKKPLGEFTLWHSPEDLNVSYDHGGFRIADAILERLEREPSWKPPRLALVSSFVKNDWGARKRLSQLLHNNDGWLDYFDKAIEDDSNDNRTKVKGFLCCLDRALVDLEREWFGLPKFTSSDEKDEMVAVSQIMRNMWESLLKRTNIEGKHVLIEGERGTGKRFTAMALARRHHRPGQDDLIVIPCSVQQQREVDQLQWFEKQLASAHGKILILTEARHLQLRLQRLLVGALEEGWLPVGDAPAKAWQPRLVIITESLPGAAPTDDEFPRLPIRDPGKIKRFQMPPLRSRKEDLNQLFLIAASKNPQRAEEPPSLTENAWIALENHLWPGNISEFFDVMDEVLTDHYETVIDEKDLPDHYRASGIARVDIPFTVDPLDSDSDAREIHVQSLHGRKMNNATREETAKPVFLEICADSFHIKVNCSEPIRLRCVEYIVICALKIQYLNERETNCSLDTLGSYLVIEGQRLEKMDPQVRPRRWFSTKERKHTLNRTQGGNAAYSALETLLKEPIAMASALGPLFEILPKPKRARGSNQEKDEHWGFPEKSVEFGKSWKWGT